MASFRNAEDIFGEDADSNDDWREHFMKVDDTNREALAAAGDQRRAAQADAKAEGRNRG